MDTLINQQTARKIAEFCQRPELEAWLLDERLAYFAMHEAEKTLSDEQLESMAWLLRDREPDRHGFVVMLRATAAQRAEAFLRTIGKWEEYQ